MWGIYYRHAVLVWKWFGAMNSSSNAAKVTEIWTPPVLTAPGTRQRLLDNAVALLLRNVKEPEACRQSQWNNNYIVSIKVMLVAGMKSVNSRGLLLSTDCGKRNKWKTTHKSRCARNRRHRLPQSGFPFVPLRPPQGVWLCGPRG